MVEEEDPTEYDWNEDVQHLLETLEDAQKALDALWRLAEPPLARNATRNLTQTARWSYYQVFDALRHSTGWLRAMPRRASDGTSVWEDSPEPAVTNDVRRSDALEESKARGAMERRRREERDPEHEDDDLAGTRLRVGNGDTVCRTETPEEAKARKARAEEKRLANLRKPPRSRKASKKR